VHIRQHPRVKFSEFRDMCSTLNWNDGQVVTTFNHFMANVKKSLVIVSKPQRYRSIEMNTSLEVFIFLFLHNVAASVELKESIV